MMEDGTAQLNCITIPPTDTHSASLIFIHGACGSAENLRDWVAFTMPDEEEFVFPHIKIIYPDAPKRPYTPDRSRSHQVWFDWPGIKPNNPEDTHTIDVSCQQINAIIEAEIAAGIPVERIIVGGLSMGGIMTLHLCCRHRRNYAGQFVLSSFLNDTSAVFKALESGPVDDIPPLFMAHGTSDPLIKHDWGRATYDRLVSYGLKVEQFHSYPYLAHSMCGDELLTLRQWVRKLLPA